MLLFPLTARKDGLCGDLSSAAKKLDHPAESCAGRPRYRVPGHLQTTPLVPLTRRKWCRLIPPLTKRHTRKLVHFLSRPEIDALLAAPDQQTWLGRRDHALLLVAVQTGLRLSELTGLQRTDVVLGRGAHVRCVGKGRKERCTPLAKTAVTVLKAWLREPPKHRSEVLFPTVSGDRLSPDSVSDLLTKHVAVATKSCPSLRKKHVTPHVLRHSMAMGLLQAGVDRALIALWLGHESVETTQIYLEANLAMKEEILAKTSPPNGKPGRYRPGDGLLTFLQNL